MDVNNLSAFLAIVETQSFSAAAERLYLTQPAISKRIAALETSLDVKLFHRIGRSVQLTEAGEALTDSARRIVDEFSRARERVTTLHGEVAGRLRIGTSHHIGLHRLPPVLREFTQHFPGVELDIHFMDSEDACAAVERGKLELAVATLPESPFERLETMEIWPDPLDFVVDANHALTESNQYAAADLAQHRAILPARGTVTREILDKALLPHNLRLSVTMETNYLETIKMMVSVGLGWSLLPRSMADDLVKLNVDIPILARRLGVAWVKNRDLSNAATTFVECCTKFKS
ncbi:MAG: LysR family transcriptional regulator [Pseudomonadota bacterium]